MRNVLDAVPLEAHTVLLMPGHVIARFTDLQRGCHQIPPRQLAETLVGQMIAHDLARYSNAEWTVEGFICHLIERIDIHVVGGQQVCIDLVTLAAGTIVDVHQQATADAHALRGDQSVAQHDGNCGIHSAAVACQYVAAK